MGARIRRCSSWTLPSVGLAQGDDEDIEPQRLQGQDLLGDEGLGQARVALEDEGDAGWHVQRSQA